MRKLLVIILSVSTVFLFSCGDDLSDTSVIMVSVANSYSGANTLKATLYDQKAIISQISYLAEKCGNKYIEYTFSQDGNSLMMDGVSYSASGVLDFLMTLDLAEDDLLVFYYSGHGGSDEEGGTVLYFDPVITNDQISTDDLVETLAAVGGKKWLILDCCYSGAAVYGNSIYKEIEFTEVKLQNTKTYSWTDESTLENIKAAFSASGSKVEGNDDLWIMTACTAYQESYESGHGFFTAGLLDTLGYNLEYESADDPSSSRLTFYRVFSEASLKTFDMLEEAAGSTYAKCQTPESTLSPVDLILFDL